jgi:hypothetical protein
VKRVTSFIVDPIIKFSILIFIIVVDENINMITGFIVKFATLSSSVHFRNLMMIS